MTRALVLGGVSFNLMIYVDAFPAPAPQTLFPRRFHETIGSTGAGKALNLRRLGLQVILHELIGDDSCGHAVSAYLRDAGVDFIHDPAPDGTQRHVNLMDADGRRISLIVRPGPTNPSFDAERIEALIPQSGYVVLNISDYCRTLIPLIRLHGKAIWTDVHDYDGANAHHRDFVEAADFLFLSSDAMPDYRAFMEQQVAQGKSLVVCTHGRHGSTALTPAGEWIETPIVESYARKDTNGAGDAFFAGVLYGHARGLPIARCLRLGTIVGGLCVTSSELAYEGLTPALVESEYARVYGAMSDER
jgi:sugar/nucleoside kinase (ribokinase family)